MAIKNFFTQTATLKRLSDITDTNKEEYTAVAGDFACHTQESEGDFNFVIEGGVKKAFNMWCGADVDIKQGDRVTIDSVEYQVFSVKTFQIIRNHNMSGNKHKECIIYLPL